MNYIDPHDLILEPPCFPELFFKCSGPGLSTFSTASIISVTIPSSLFRWD